MNNHCHFQIAAFGLKRMSELESPPPALDTVTDAHREGERKESGGV